MHDFVVVDVLEAEANLYEPLEDLVLLEGDSGLALAGDACFEVSAFGVLHDDADVLVLVEEALTVGDDVLVAQGLHHLDFPQDVLLLLQRLLVADDLHQGPRVLLSHSTCGPARTAPGTRSRSSPVRSSSASGMCGASASCSIYRSAAPPVTPLTILINQETTIQLYTQPNSPCCPSASFIPHSNLNMGAFRKFIFWLPICRQCCFN